MTNKENKIILKLIEKGIKEFPKVLKKKEKAFKERKKRVKAFDSISKEIQKSEIKSLSSKLEVHPWRLCPLGKYYRGKHQQRSYVRKNGVSVRSSVHPNECVTNKTGKDQLYIEEIHEIANRHFGTLKNLPNSGILTQYQNESNFDSIIAGWTQYWNEVLKPSIQLDPNLVKALIATESGFNPESTNNKKGLKRARGLMQVTDESLKLLSFRSKELKDHFVNLKEDDMLDPNLAICAGVRWIFRKNDRNNKFESFLK